MWSSQSTWGFATYLVFDADADKTDKKRQSQPNTMKDNKALQALAGVPDPGSYAG